MQHQINTDELGNPVFLNLEIDEGCLLIKDENMRIIKKTVGNPSKPGRPNNELFNSIEEAYDWFLTTSMSNRLDQEELQE